MTVTFLFFYGKADSGRNSDLQKKYFFLWQLGATLKNFVITLKNSFPAAYSSIFVSSTSYFCKHENRKTQPIFLTYDHVYQHQLNESVRSERSRDDELPGFKSNARRR